MKHSSKLEGGGHMNNELRRVFLMAVEYQCCETQFFIRLLIILLLVLFAGLMSGLTLGLMSLSLVILIIYMYVCVCFRLSLLI